MYYGFYCLPGSNDVLEFHLHFLAGTQPQSIFERNDSFEKARDLILANTL